jgi:hypothetical protein
MLNNKFFCFIPLIFLLSSCSTLVVHEDYDASRSFTNLKTYAWVPDTPAKTNNPQLDSDTLVQGRIHGEIENWLNSHGYKQGVIADVDFLVAYQLVVEDKTQIRVINDYYDYPRGWRYGYGGYYGGGSRAYTYEYKQGTLVIDFVDPKTKKLMWRGTGTDEVMASASPEEKRKQIKKAVDKILGQFPPKG